MRMKRLVLTTVLPVSNAESTAASEERQIHWQGNRQCARDHRGH
jgi:hypothetical protein